MKGFLCHSSAVCLSHEQRSSVVLPERMNKCVRIGEQRPLPSFRVSSSKNNQMSDNHFQVVVMRVSIHCQGCAGKVKKHLSKMQGVRSFSIDLESKRVTVSGHVSPSGVLESMSKVKKAEFWSY